MLLAGARVYVHWLNKYIGSTSTLVEQVEIVFYSSIKCKSYCIYVHLGSYT